MGVVDLATGMPQVRAGKLRAIAVSGPTRSAQLPEVPTLVEQGVPFDTASWYAVFGPAKMPAPLVERLDQALGKVLATPEAAERIRALGMEPDPITRVAFERQVREDMTVWAGIIERGGIRAE
jgi:tripartite-type tricarboxylate transporter receptor subunit TctC